MHGLFHLSRLDQVRRKATLCAFAIEMEIALTDAAVFMMEKMIGSMFRRAERSRTERVTRSTTGCSPGCRYLRARLEACPGLSAQRLARELGERGYSPTDALVAAPLPATPRHQSPAQSRPRKGKSGRLLRRPHRQHDGATVV